MVCYFLFLVDFNWIGLLIQMFDLGLELYNVVGDTFILPNFSYERFRHKCLI
jgi:hypothetical protein